MADDTLRCPRCEYENIVLTCGFCIQCGNDLSDLMPQVETLSAAIGTAATNMAYSTNVSAAPSNAADQRASSAYQAAVLEIDSSRPVANVSLDQLISDAAILLETKVQDTGSGWKLTLPTSGGRQQTVHILRGNRDQAAELVSFLSICGEATTANAMALLEWNGRLTGCAFAARTIGGKRMFVLTANWPAHVLDSGLIADTLRTIARRADQVEAKLSTGPDKF